MCLSANAKSPCEDIQFNQNGDHDAEIKNPLAYKHCSRVGGPQDVEKQEWTLDVPLCDYMYFYKGRVGKVARCCDIVNNGCCYEILRQILRQWAETIKANEGRRNGKTDEFGSKACECMRAHQKNCGANPDIKATAIKAMRDSGCKEDDILRPGRWDPRMWYWGRW